MRIPDYLYEETGDAKINGHTVCVKLPRRSPSRNSEEWRESYCRVLIV